MIAARSVVVALALAFLITAVPNAGATTLGVAPSHVVAASGPGTHEVGFVEAWEILQCDSPGVFTFTWDKSRQVAHFAGESACVLIPDGWGWGQCKDEAGNVSCLNEKYRNGHLYYRTTFNLTTDGAFVYTWEGNVVERVTGTMVRA